MLVSEPTATTEYYSAADIIARCEVDFDFFCRVALPEVYTTSFPDFYIGVFWKIVDGTIKARDLSKFAIGIPRAHAKTTWVKLVIAWLLIFSKKKYFLLIGSITKKAADIIADVMSILETDNMRALFGRWDADTSKDSIEEKTFTFRGRKITLMAAAPGGSVVRGTSKGFSRPDFILMDDMITEADAKSPAVSEERYLWLLGTLLLAGDPKNCQYVYLGNKYAGDGCILSKLEKSKDWTSLVVGAILADGQPLWPELHSLESLQARLKSYIDALKPEIFFAELMNYVGDDNKTQFDFGNVEIFTPDPSWKADADWLIIDPAGGKEGGDSQVIGHCQSWNAKPHLKHAEVFDGSAPGLVYHTIKYCLENKVPLVFVEGGGYQVTLIQWFNHILAEKGILGLQVLEIPTQGRHKNTRILAGLKSLARKELTISEGVRSAIFAEIRAFNPLIKHNVDDRLDIVARASESLILYPSEIVAAQYYYSDTVPEDDRIGELIESDVV